MARRTNTQVSARIRRGKAGRRGWGLCRVQVNSEQVGLESLAEAGERLTSAGSSFHRWLDLRARAAAAAAAACYKRISTIAEA